MANPDQLLIHRFVNGTAPLAFDSNPVAALLATRLIRVNRKLGRVELSFEPSANCEQGANVVQGGMVCAMLDFAMAFAVLARLKPYESTATIGINVSFLRALHPGPLLGYGSVDRLGKTIVFARAHLASLDGELLATATGSLFVLR